MRVGGEPSAKESVKIDFDEQGSRQSGTVAGRISYDYRTKTDAEGRFVFDRVPPGKARVVRFVMIPHGDSTWSEHAIDSKPVELVAGQTVQVDISGIAGEEAKRRVPDMRAREEKWKSIEEANAERGRRVEAAMKILNAKPRVPQGQRVEAALEVLRDYYHKTPFETWAQAIRELVGIGTPAVPAVTAELDRTTRNETLRALGFVLRGIGDPRSVPALIRAIPRVYPGDGSDMGYPVKKNSALHAFMVRNDNRPENATMIAFGLPIREIMPALEKITGESHGWLGAQLRGPQGQWDCPAPHEEPGFFAARGAVGLIGGRRTGRTSFRTSPRRSLCRYAIRWTSVPHRSLPCRNRRRETGFRVGPGLR